MELLRIYISWTRKTSQDLEAFLEFKEEEINYSVGGADSCNFWRAGVRFFLLEEIYQQKDEPIEPPYYKETALYLLSGGTTGVPKVIPKSHAGYAQTKHRTSFRYRNR